MSKEKEPNDVNVKGVLDADGKRVVIIGVGDPVLSGSYPTKVTAIENGIATLSGLPEGKNKADLKDLEPLFFENEAGKKVWTKFTYNEISQAVKNTENFAVNIPKEQVVALMLGNKSPLLSFKKQIEDKMVEVQGKIELRRGEGGKPYVAHQVKNKELNLDRPIYGLNFNEAQKAQLVNTAELGLVSGFKAGDKDFSLWVSLDKDLNSVVTKRESDVNISKIYGVDVSEKQKEALKKGEGVVIELKNESKIFVQVSAKSANADGLKIYSHEKALEFGLIKDEKKNQAQEKTEKASKGKGMKM